MIYSFKNDYSEGAHERIIESLNKTNLFQEGTYGEDIYCLEASELIREKLKYNSDIHFVTGGTQANLIIASAFLKPYESIISVNSAHICLHEAGAIEATGHKINTVENIDGKINIEQIKDIIDFHTDEHMVKPKMVFISNSTELGTIYNKKELELLSDFCRKNKLILYLDGARLGSALTSHKNDLKLEDLSKILDAFYIGGTKNGALLGEAIVINNDILKENFRFHIKQKGGLLAKSRILGIQFLELFKDDLYFDLAKHANNMAFKLSQGIENLNYKLLYEPVSNQIFPIFPNSVIEKLNQKYDFYIWNKTDNNNSSIRLVTSWATKEEFVDRFIEDLNNIKNSNY